MYFSESTKTSKYNFYHYMKLSPNQTYQMYLILKTKEYKDKWFFSRPTPIGGP